MFICYYDETGDDGYPEYTTPIFVLTGLYLHHRQWNEVYKDLFDYREYLKKAYNFPLRLEFHTRDFILNKRPYDKLEMSDSQRIFIIDLLVGLISQLDVKLINVVINKPLIFLDSYKVLDKALDFSINRIETDLSKLESPKKPHFIIITDDGRVGIMRQTVERIKEYNPIPSKFQSAVRDIPIRLLIEDPLPVSSKHSNFIQVCDLVSFIVYSYSLLNLGVGKRHARTPSVIDLMKLEGWLDTLIPSLNTDASNEDPYGIVYHPK
ncbi:DUF3800 domain-containing protein [Desulfobacterota bacterium AH_259_B03_O07]|nr:DUF3800 domain-containing protein [Desulfobacterota bacterium AH_259_B03_O07]